MNKEAMRYLFMNIVFIVKCCFVIVANLLTDCCKCCTNYCCRCFYTNFNPCTVPQVYDCKSVVLSLKTINTFIHTTINSHDSSSFTLIHISVSNRAKLGLHVIVKLL
mgnify:CR=1 FL=1